MVERPPKIPTVVAAMILSLAIAGFAATSSAEAAGDCALIAPTAIEKALHLPHIYESNPFLLGAPPTGSAESDCHVAAWSGAKPRTSKRIAAKLANGTLVELNITTWRPASGLLATAWPSYGFNAKLKALALEGQESLVTALHGKSFAPPALGANPSGYKGVKGPTREVEAFWSSATLYDIILLTVVETKEKPAVAQLENIVAIAVPAFGL